jgi:hypothetical protein
MGIFILNKETQLEFYNKEQLPTVQILVIPEKSALILITFIIVCQAMAPLVPGNELHSRATKNLTY